MFSVATHLNWASMILAAICSAFLFRQEAFWIRTDRWGNRLRQTVESHPWISLLAGLLCIFMAYSLTLGQTPSWDEISYALPLRTTEFTFHPNHFLPHVAAKLFFDFARIWNPQIEPIQSSIYLNILSGLVNVVFMGMIARLLWNDWTIALGLGVLYGFSCWTWKSATSSEIYILTISAMLMPLLWFGHLASREDWSWKSITILSFLLNVCVLTHNVTGIVAAAYGIPLLFLNRKALWRLSLTGFILFVLIQAITLYTHHIRTVEQWITFISYNRGYMFRNYTAYYQFPNSFIYALRDGSFTAVVGLESSLHLMSLLSKVATLVLYSYFWGLYFAILACIGLNLRKVWENFRQSLLAQVIIGHFIVLWLFAGRTNVLTEELMHWLTPFFMLSCFFIGRAIPLSKNRVAFVLAISIPLLAFTSFGTSPESADKLWSIVAAPDTLGRDLRQAGLANDVYLITTSGSLSSFAIHYHAYPFKVVDERPSSIALSSGKIRLLALSDVLAHESAALPVDALQRINDNVYLINPKFWKADRLSPNVTIVRFKSF